MSISVQQIREHENHGPWRSLLARATSMVEQVSRIAGFDLEPLLGGGTRLMLSLHHRLSDDIDLFIRDPQWIGYLTPRLNDQVIADAYEENAVSLKLRYDIGEIDFIVAMSLLGLPVQEMKGINVKLEPIAEVLAKKLFYRGSMLTPRDLFDWWAIATISPHEIPQAKIALLLKDRLDGIESALRNLRLSAAARSSWHLLRTHYSISLDEAVVFGLQQVEYYRGGAAFELSPLP